ncbi:MAG: tetratricopeptide repeat protein [Elusimicrobiota bacterium]
MVFFKKNELEIGMQFLEEGNFSSAIDCFKKFLEEHSKHPQAQCCLAEAYFQNAQIDLAKQVLIDLIKLSPSAEIISKILEITNWKKLVSDNFFNSYFAFSPDGRKLVFVSVRRDSNGDGKLNIFDRGGIYLLDLATGEEKLLVTDDYYNTFPRFSPDNKKIVFVSARRDSNGDNIIDFQDNGSIYLLDLETGRETMVLGDEYRPKFPSIFPDNKNLVCCGWDKSRQKSGIFMVGIDDGKIKKITPDQFESSFPVISPDGKKITYTSWREDTNEDGIINIRDNSGIYLFDLTTGREREIVDCQYDNSYPQWLPSGEGFVYLSRRRDTNNDEEINSLDNSGIYLFDLKRKKERMLINDDYYNKFPSFVGNGRLLLYIGSCRQAKRTTERDYFENKGLYCFDLNNKEEKQLVSSKYYGCRFPVGSPVENKAAYLSWRKGSNRGIYLANLDRLPTKEELMAIVAENL